MMPDAKYAIGCQNTRELPATGRGTFWLNPGVMSSAATSFTRLALRGVDGLVDGGLGTAEAVVCALVRINDLQIRI